MNYSVTIFDIGGAPLANQPLELLRDGRPIAAAETNAFGVAIFDVPFTSGPGLAIRSGTMPSTQ